MAIIITSSGVEILVNDEDFGELNQYKWCISKNGYAVRRGKEREQGTIYMHRAILGLPKFKEDKQMVDHINRNRIDNRRENLRIVSASQNAWNMSVNQNTSGYTGVLFIKKYTNKPWQARISVHGKQVWLGSFNTPEEANEAYQAAKSKYHVF